MLNKVDIKLPTLPGIALELINAMKGDEPDIQRIAEIISADAPLSAKVLKTVNSPLYGLANKISSVNQAIVLLGANSVKSLAMSFSLIANFRSKKGSCFTYSKFWKDSLIGAVAARAISRRLNTKFTDELFFCGLMQNIGSLILAESFPNDYEAVIEEMARLSKTAQKAELQILGTDHANVGELAIRKWGLPEFFVASIRYHHEPDMFESELSKENLSIQILHLSSLFIDVFNSNDIDIALGEINQYGIKYGFASLFSPTEIARQVIDEVKPMFPLFEIEVDDSELLRISESAKSNLYELSTEIVTQQKISDLKIEELKLKSVTDGLTNLYNQRHFIEILKREIYRATRYKIPLSLIMADIDEFKAINDFYGHLAGDYSLKTIATRLKNTIRESDYLFRYGGEEFAVILPSTSSFEAKQIAYRLGDAIRATPIIYNGKTLQITMSFGVAHLGAKASVDLEGLIHMADEALYEAKNSGRDRCCMYEEKSFDHTNPTILIVDDEEVVLITLAKMLERLGFGVIEANEGIEAMSLIDRHKDLLKAVIIDAMMPGISAHDILSKLKRSCSDVRIFLSSGHSQERIGQHLLDECDGFLAKPFTIEELTEKLSTLSDRDRVDCSFDSRVYFK